MNPLTNLIGKKFKELNFNELYQVIQSYLESNQYFDTLEIFEELAQYPKAHLNPTNLIATFESNIGGYFLLKDYFKFWTK